jgi:hypothetical protein
MHKTKISRYTFSLYRFAKSLPSVADPDPGSGAFLTPGSGIRIEQTGSYSYSLETIFWGLKYLHSFMRIRDPDTGWKKFGSGIRKNILDPQHCPCHRVLDDGIRDPE